MGEFEDTAIIAYPVLWPSGHRDPQIPDVHSTVVFLGDVSNSEFTKEDVLDAMREFDVNVYRWVDVDGLDWFGPNHDVPVLRISHSGLQGFYERLTEKLAIKGIFSASEFPYSPHVTIDMETATIGWPNHLMLGPVELWWREEKIKIAR